MPNLADQIREPGGPTSLDVKAIPDGSIPQRSGTSIVGVQPSTLAVGSASGLVETGGPTTLTMGAVADTEVLTRSGTTIDGVLPSAMTVGVATYANGVRETGGPTTLTMGVVADTEIFARSGTTVDGITPADIASALRATPVNAATYDWDSSALDIAITYAVAACDVSLPAEASVTNWPVNQAREMCKANAAGFGINLLVAGNCTINGGAAGVDMAPVPTTDSAPSVSTLAQRVRVVRLSATSFFVCGYGTV